MEAPGGTYLSGLPAPAEVVDIAEGEIGTAHAAVTLTRSAS